ncbi:MAG TPA: hypothetical protein VIY86_06345 [Pirellulaceae bacterium]
MLTAEVEWQGARGWAVCDSDQWQWIPTQGRDRPMDALLALCWYKGRRLLRAFNGDPLECGD